MTRRYLDQRLRLSLLRAVDAVEAHRSLLAASVVLGITQPALTKSLHELEDIVGARLFDRHSRGVRPTEAGRAFVQTARRVLAELRRLDEEFDQLSSPGGGTVALGALPVAAAGVLPGALSRLKADYPHIKVRLQEGRTRDLLPLLASGEIDLIVGQLYEPAIPDRFSREPLWTEPISILARNEHPIFADAITARCASPLRTRATHGQSTGMAWKSNTCSLFLAFSRPPLCVPAPTVSSARCCMQRTSLRSCRD